MNHGACPGYVAFTLLWAALCHAGDGSSLAEYSVSQQGTGWRAACEFRPGPAMKPEPVLMLAFPGHTPSQAGDFVQLTREIRLPPARTMLLLQGRAGR